MSERIVIFDLETGGVNWQTDPIVQFAAVVFSPEKHSAYTLMSTYVKPDSEVSAEALATHGIDPALTDFAPTAPIVLSQFRNTLKTLERKHTVILAGHNSENFDLPFIDRYLPGAGFKQFPHIDTFFLARRHFPNSEQKLTLFAQEQLDMSPEDVEGAHDATFDCYLVAEVLPIILGQLEISTYKNLAAWAEKAVPYKTMPFGRHKSLPIEDVPTGYMAYCHRNFEKMDRDMKITFEQRLGIGDSCREK